MNVGDLIEELQAFGDHLPVAVVFVKGASEYVVTDVTVSDRTVDGELTVTVEAEVP